MFLPAWTVWWIQNVDRMKLSWRPWEKVDGLKEQTQKRINQHLISKGHPQMFQSEGALCFTTPKAEHYRDDVSGWKQVLKMSGGWLDIQAWRKWNRKLHNNKKKPSWAKMTRTQKGVHGNIFSTLWKGFLLMHNQPPVFQTTCLFLLVLLPEIVPWGVMVVQKPFFCEGAQVLAVQCWNVLCCFQNRLQVFIWNCCACGFWGIYKICFSPPAFLKAGSISPHPLVHFIDTPF